MQCRSAAAYIMIVFIIIFISLGMNVECLVVNIQQHQMIHQEGFERIVLGVRCHFTCIKIMVDMLMLMRMGMVMMVMVMVI